MTLVAGSESAGSLESAARWEGLPVLGLLGGTSEGEMRGLEGRPARPAQAQDGSGER